MTFSYVYDVLMADVDYEVLYEAIQPFLNTNDYIIDAGCGTGRLLEVLLTNNLDAIGIDHDVEMLKIAKNRLMTSGLSQPLFEHDLRQPIGTTADVIISLFDVMHYFKGNKTVFKNIYRALMVGGRFIFDLYDAEKMRSYDGYVEQASSPIDYRWQIKIDNHLIRHIIDVDDQTHHILQYLYPLENYIQWLDEVGFKDIKTIQSPDERKVIVIAYK